MGISFSHSSEDNVAPQSSNLDPLTSRRRQNLQPSANTEWSLALSTQRNLELVQEQRGSGIDQSKTLAIAQPTRMWQTQPKADALTSQAHTEQSSCTSLTISEAYPRTKPRPVEPPLRHHQEHRARDAAREEHGSEQADAELHPLERLYRSTPHKMTLKLWIEEERLLRAKIYDQELCCSSAEREIYFILGLNFIFQAILVAGTAQASALDCQSSWVPLIMSLIISIATAFACLRKLGERERLLCQLKACRTDTKVMMAYIDKLRSQGDMFDLMDLPQLSSSMPAGGAACFPRKMITLWSLRFFALLFLCLFSVMSLVSFRTILCGHGRGR